MIKRAIERGKYEVELTREDLYDVWPQDNQCPIMETIFTIGGDLDTSPSLDRIDPSKGYVVGNIQIISNVANRMKNSADDSQLLRFAHYYINHYRRVYASDGQRDDTTDLYVLSGSETLGS